MKPLHVSEEAFARVLAAKETVLIDFYADWCGPCRMLAPTLEEIADEREDILVGKINVDDAPALAEKYGVMSIPTLLVIKNGKEVARLVGVRPKADILKALG